MASGKEYYRADGVKIDFDPYAPGMAEKYGLPGNTDPEGQYVFNIDIFKLDCSTYSHIFSKGFDPYADTVGAGIYGGGVKRDGNGNILIGEQYQSHNSRPGPIYDGSGYSLMSKAIHQGPEKVKEILADFPFLKGKKAEEEVDDGHGFTIQKLQIETERQQFEIIVLLTIVFTVVDEISTGGARPLHVCGMSRKGQLATQVLIDAGADMHALDTYNYNALHRMASNDLEIGAEALVKAGMDPNYKPPSSDSSPIDIARRSRALKFLMKMQELGHYD